MFFPYNIYLSQQKSKNVRDSRLNSCFSDQNKAIKYSLIRSGPQVQHKRPYIQNLKTWHHQISEKQKGQAGWNLVEHVRLSVWELELANEIA